LQQNQLQSHQEKLLLIATITASGMAFIDFSAISVALPAIQRAFDLQGKQLIWIVNSYTLLLSALILLGGSLGDYFGRKKVFVIGIIIFSIASLICGLAPGKYALIAGRAIQGVGGALMVPGSLSNISALIPQQRRGKAYGTWSTFSALTTIIGPVIGGWLAGAGLWRFIFFINIPLAILAIVILIRYIPETKNSNAGNIDVLGAFLITIGLAAITYALIEASEKGWQSTSIIIIFCLGLVGLLLFILREWKYDYPIMPLQLFRNRTFSGANLLTLLVYGALNITLFFLPLNLIQVQGYSEFQAGMSILPFAVIIAFLSRLVGVWVDKYGNRLFLSFGPIITAVGFLVLSFSGLTKGPQSYWINFFIPIAIIGTGMGITVAPLTNAVMSAVSETFAGIASGINNAIARTAGVLAIALMGTIAIIDFEANMQSQYLKLNLDKEEVQAVQAEIPKLAEADPPAILTGEKQIKLQEMIDNSFIGTFQFITLIAAAIAFAGGLIAFITIRN